VDSPDTAALESAHVDLAAGKKGRAVTTKDDDRVVLSRAHYEALCEAAEALEVHVSPEATHAEYRDAIHRGRGALTALSAALEVQK
jgi:hypothetical protein